MGACRVSFTDPDGIEHSVEVEAGSLYEAVALAVAELRRAEVTTAEPADLTEFVVTAFRKPTQHRVRFNQVRKWAEPTTREGPAGLVKRQRVRELLEIKETR
jgi:hypothetical protein